MTRKSPKQKRLAHYLVRLLLSICCIVIVSGIAVFATHIMKPSLPCANSISCAKDLQVQVENNQLGTFAGRKVMPPVIDLALKTLPTQVLGISAGPGEKHVYVDLSKQTLYAYQGKTLVMQKLISSGKWHPTPTGDFTIWVKLRATRMTGGSGDDFYDLPNVPYVMFFYNADVPKYLGFSLHGAYWHNNFGHPMSHGCVNMRIVDAEQLYDWVDPQTTGLTTYATDTHPGTTVTIYGEPPIN